MRYIDSLLDLESHYGCPPETSLRKVARHLTPEYSRWIAASRFCALSTVGPDGTDCSPRGDDGAVVSELDPQTLLLPDWIGNNRIDSLRNIVTDGRVSLMFMVAGSTNVVRVNGQARLTADPEMTTRFTRGGKSPRSVIVIRVGEVYFQCARALMRARLWDDGDQSAGLPTAGEILKAMTDGDTGGAQYDREWPARAADSLW